MHVINNFSFLHYFCASDYSNFNLEPDLVCTSLPKYNLRLHLSMFPVIVIHVVDCCCIHFVYC